MSGVTKGGLPPQTALMTGRARFTEAYAVIPKGVMCDIVSSYLPAWQGLRAWILARPMSGFSETFSWYLMELAPDGGSSTPEPEPGVEGMIFVTEGALKLTIEGKAHKLAGGYCAFLPAATNWEIINQSKVVAKFHWVRKRYLGAQGIAPPRAFVVREQDITPIAMPETDGKWSTTCFVDPEDLTHDMHLNIVTFAPGARIPFEETHVMEHGIFVLEGRAVYKLNTDWVEVEAGDFIWLRAFCPQACYAGGPEPFRYLLYKDVNRHVVL